MNVFVLCTGRSGSTSFIKACQHITNYTAGHETQSHKLGNERFNFSDSHIEADNRLTWQLGQLDKTYGKDAYYIYLKRDKKAVAKSFMNRFLLPKSMIYAYANAVKKQPPENLTKAERYSICQDYVQTVEDNLLFFLKDKPHYMLMSLENIQDDFKAFWNNIRAKGDINLALQEFDKKHNVSSKNKINLKYSIKQVFKKFVFLIKETF